MSFKQKLHAHGWFILINALVLMLIASRYFAFLPEFPTDPLGITFILAGTWGQMTLLAAIIGLVTIPTLFLPKPFRNGTQALIASLGVATLFIDTIVFAQYRFHINAVVLELVMSGQIVSFPLITWLMVIGGVALLLAAQWWTIRWLENGAPVRALKLGRKFALLTFAALLATNAIHIWAAAHAYQPVTTVKRYLPLFYPATADKFMRKQGWVDEEALERQKALAFKRKNDLNYPLAPLQTQPVEKPLNIMLLVVDSWRADTFNADNTPNMWKYAQSGVVFNNHIATGNATRTGIFGLFYGIPGTYWHGFLANQQSPVLIDRLQALDYQLGIFTAAQLRKPEFNQTVFTKVENLRIGSEGSRPSELDADLTQDWLAWYDQRDTSKPTFSFLFYDAPHGYDFPADFEPKYEPMLKEVNYLKLNNDTDPTPFFNRYKTSVRYVDSMATKVLDKLKESGDLENTVVIITGDHGQEMNDNKLNFWGHNSNFTDAQVNVPFAIFGPGVDAAKMQWSSEALTSHQDVVPTLMKHYLGVTNDVKDYSVGEDLLGDAVKRDWIISSNYSGYAIITDDNILEVSGGGQYQFMDKTNRQLKDQQPNFTYLQQALEQISRFSK
ncbi:TPA: DUF3413 domain-containing protein [Vibrio vulnificus]|uniref:DUF3413 domain-containing protein n=1 Tax=Vibrio vulnificus TaxID=672 RepID=A0A8H9N407_VIBVL|nr:DUF3413 domain-containing protein [Vibrio vulnificus]EGQ9933069.1 DUF3413 domain-containing protein [Vibrio vulnificus]EGR0231969.1 DUF3413 domain-containing protein [Vibrio vulnificus]EHU5004846.1 DUF3413 domain-containing protein [Vibrio vulnificus]EJV9423297.1 DUF3413 domain-containing protein [Vibrio vulnificus]ELI0348297.1 DUF3413 domain-containing protein [Vibrio vulnificus]